MKDKLFWIALIFAGFYFFNKMKSSEALHPQMIESKDSQTDNRIVDKVQQI